MDTFKIKNFEEDNAGVKFPWVRLLASEETCKIREIIAGKFHMTTDSACSRFVEEFHGKFAPLEDFDACDVNFDIGKTIRRLNWEPGETIFITFINGNNFDVIDELMFSDFCNVFKYVWHPFSEDMVIFNGALSWFLFVSHDGAIGILTANPRF